MEKILFLLTFLVGEAQSSKLSVEAVNLDKNPASAPTIAVGTIEENFWGKQTFHSELGWTNLPQNLTIKKHISPLGASKKGKAGLSYILYSENATSIKGELNENSYIKLIELDSVEAKKIILSLLDKELQEGKINPSWQYCEKDDDCLKVIDRCGGAVSISEPFLLWYNKAQMKSNKCYSSNEHSNKLVSKCIRRFCRFK